MYSARRLAALALCSAALSASACADEANAPSGSPTALTAVVPAGGATSVNPASPIVLTFSGPMAQGMEAYMDMHVGTTAGAIMPMTCTWSADRTTLTCTHAPLASGSAYTIHVGGGMTDTSGNPIDMDDMVNMMGGAWLQQGMMGGMHAGQPTNMMGAGWMGSNGSYGMIFTFTTS